MVVACMAGQKLGIVLLSFFFYLFWKLLISYHNISVISYDDVIIWISLSQCVSDNFKISCNFNGVISKIGK